MNILFNKNNTSYKLNQPKYNSKLNICKLTVSKTLVKPNSLQINLYSKFISRNLCDFMLNFTSPNF